jgi:hypothetical protein
MNYSQPATPNVIRNFTALMLGNTAAESKCIIALRLSRSPRIDGFGSANWSVGLINNGGVQSSVQINGGSSPGWGVAMVTMPLGGHYKYCFQRQQLQYCGHKRERFDGALRLSRHRQKLQTILE